MTVFGRSILFVAAALALFLSGCGKEEDPATSARRFFEQIAAGQAREAYESASFNFKAQQNAKAFEATVKDLKLTEYAGAQFETENRERTSVRLRADLKLKNGESVPLIVTVNRETGAWRVFSIRSPRSPTTGLIENRFSLVGKAATLTDLANRPMPDDEAQRRLVRETLLSFNDAVQQQSFSDFYEGVSKAWRAQLTKGQLQRAFQPFLDKKVDISGIKNVEAVFDPAPAINSDGLLVLTGSYPTSPYKVFFALKFIYELPNWKLFGIDVNLRK
jgi:hypothetical protein